VTRLVDRIDRFQQRHRWLGFPIAVLYKFIDDQGPYLAALITYYGFLSLFPLLLLLASVLGFLLQGNPDLQADILNSTLRQLPVIGNELGEARGLRGSTGAVIVGGVVATYGALGVAQAVQNAMNVAWAVPRHQRPNPIAARVRSLLLIATAGLAILATTVTSAIVSTAGDWGPELGRGTAILATAATVIANAAVFVLAFHVATARRPPWRDVLPGAITAAILWQLLQLAGPAWAASTFKGSSDTYGVFALVLGLLGWLFVAASGLVLCVEINVVRSKRLYPRALMTVFTDNVDLTSADRRTYTDAALAQRHKGFESVTVSFEERPPRSAATDEKDEDQTLSGGSR